MGYVFLKRLPIKSLLAFVLNKVTGDSPMMSYRNSDFKPRYGTSLASRARINSNKIFKNSSDNFTLV